MNVPIDISQLSSRFAVRRLSEDDAGMILQICRENPQYYTRDEVCKLLHISSVTFHCWVGQGRIQTVKAGRRTLVDREDLQKRISSGEIGRYQHARK